MLRHSAKYTQVTLKRGETGHEKLITVVWRKAGMDNRVKNIEEINKNFFAFRVFATKFVKYAKHDHDGFFVSLGHFPY